MRRKAGEATIEMYDLMIQNNYGGQGTEWEARKIDFCKSSGLFPEV